MMISPSTQGLCLCFMERSVPNILWRFGLLLEESASQTSREYLNSTSRLPDISTGSLSYAIKLEVTSSGDERLSGRALVRFAREIRARSSARREIYKRGGGLSITYCQTASYNQQISRRNRSEAMGKGDPG